MPLSLWLSVYSKYTVNKMNENRLFNCFMAGLVLEVPGHKLKFSGHAIIPVSVRSPRGLLRLWITSCEKKKDTL